MAKNVFHRQHYNKIAAFIGRLDVDDATKAMLGEKFADMFEEDHPHKEGDDTYYFRRDRFYEAITKHHAERFAK